MYQRPNGVCVCGGGGGGGGGGGRGAVRTFNCLTKHILYKSIGRSQLTYNELEEILLDVEINWNNHPLTYVDTSN